MSAPDSVRDLVERFERNLSEYRSQSYNETETRREFIDPLFKALGWDIDNSRGYADAYKDVIHEDAIVIKGRTKAPDYAFCIGGTRKFYLEAKKPSVSLESDPDPARQVRRYAWTAKHPLCILTDFEELAVYDGRVKPNANDTARTARILYFTYKDYLTRWDEIAAIFSREAVLKGAFDKYGESSRGKRGTTEVDDEFLKEIELWRENLAVCIARRNKELSSRELNTAVQLIVDRLVFLRIAEDRGMEPYGQLKTLASGGAGVYQRLLRVFAQGYQKYNSGLFHFSDEKGQSSSPDKLTPALDVDDRTLKDIFRRLYYPDSPYEFSVLPAEILGQVYERFLGNVIRLTAGHQAKVEQKEEVRKAGGVYYTPTYIVDYIVKETLGRLLDGKTPAEAAELRILDPACGSGSFLLGAYQHLLNWHRDYYVNSGSKAHRKYIYQAASGEWRLVTEEKKRILLNNIYGVDIDQQAVEVTKLSLLLKVLEGENEQTLKKQFELFKKRALPDLGGNIKCGNSLIGSDFYAGQQLGFLDEEEQYRINAFDWQKEFAPIMKRGGFDAVIGNPPYVRQELLGNFKDYFKTGYKSYHGVADLYVYFIERGYGLLKEGGKFGYIVANKWMRANYGQALRRWLKTVNVEAVVDFGDLPVFGPRVTTYPCLLFLSSTPPDETFEVTQADTLAETCLEEYVQANHHTVRQTALDDSGWSLSDEASQALLEKLKGSGVPLGDYVQGKIYYGIKTGLNEAFVIDAATRAALIAEDPKSAELIKPFLVGRDIKRYQTPKSERYLIFTRRGVQIKDYPAIEKHLLRYKKQLTPKPKNWKGEKWEGRKPGAYEWYEIQDTIDYYQEFEKAKILWP